MRIFLLACFLGGWPGGLMLAQTVPQETDPAPLEETKKEVEDEVILVKETRLQKADLPVSSLKTLSFLDLYPIGLTSDDNPVEYVDQPEYLDAVIKAIDLYLEDQYEPDRFCHARTEKRPAVRKALKGCFWRRKTNRQAIDLIFLSEAGDKVSLLKRYGTSHSFGSIAHLFQFNAITEEWIFVDRFSVTHFE